MRTIGFCTFQLARRASNDANGRERECELIASELGPVKEGVGSVKRKQRKMLQFFANAQGTLDIKIHYDGPTELISLEYEPVNEASHDGTTNGYTFSFCSK